MNTLNVYQANVSQLLKFMYKAKHNLNSRVFDNAISKIYDRYPTSFFRSNFKDVVTKTRNQK